MTRKRKFKKKGKKKKTCKVDTNEETYKNAPHSFIFQRGHVGKNVKQLVKDMRRVGEPFTAINLQVRKHNVLKDFVSVAGFLHVTHFMIFTKTEKSVNMRLCRLPQGPTLTFRVMNYSLIGDVVSSLKKPSLQPLQYLHHPLLVMNNFSGEGRHMKLMATMFQNMFPSINVHKVCVREVHGMFNLNDARRHVSLNSNSDTGHIDFSNMFLSMYSQVNLNEVRRCVLMNYNSDTGHIDFRHYNIRVAPAGVSRKVKKLLQSKIPNLSNCTDISEYITQAGFTSSESEGEMDGPHNEVVLPQDIKSRGNIKSTRSAIRLTELGPRMTLELMKIEDGIASGEILYHALIHRTPEEVAQIKAKREQKRKLKESRRQQQLANVKRKEKELEEHKQRSLAGMKRKQQEIEGEDVESPETAGIEPEEDDDVKYFKEEVGHMPDRDANLPKGTKRTKVQQSHADVKKRKKDFDGKGKHKDKDGKNVKGKLKESDNSDGQKKKRSWTTMTIEQRNRAKKKLKERKLKKKFGKKKH